MAGEHRVRLPLMTPAVAAGQVGQTQDWMERYSRTGRLPHHKLGRKTRFCQGCLEEIAQITYQPGPGHSDTRRQPPRATAQRYSRQTRTRGRYPRPA